MAYRPCSLCDRTTRTHRVSEQGICATCEVALIYWRNKTPSQIVKRARALDSYQNRMELLLGNVKSTRKRRRRAA